MASTMHAWFLAILLCVVLAAGNFDWRGGSGSSPLLSAPDFSLSITSPFSSTSVSLVQSNRGVPLTVSIVGSNGFK
jgi:hypothetical protein